MTHPKHGQHNPQQKHTQYYPWPFVARFVSYISHVCFMLPVEAPKTKLQRSTKIQDPKWRTGNWDLELEVSLELGAWLLELQGLYDGGRLTLGCSRSRVAPAGPTPVRRISCCLAANSFIIDSRLSYFVNPAGGENRSFDGGRSSNLEKRRVKPGGLVEAIRKGKPFSSGARQISNAAVAPSTARARAFVR